MHYASLVIQVRRRLDDPTASRWTNQDIGDLLDEGAKYLQSNLKILENRTSLSLVANQRDYELASTVLEPKVLEYMDSGGYRRLRGVTYSRIRDSRATRTGTIPFAYSFVDNEQTIQLTPAPDTAAPSTTLSGNHSAAATTLVVVSTASLYDEGRVLVDSEVIGYTGKTTTTLTGCTRGLEGTTAATHSDGATVTARNLFITGIQRITDRVMYRYYTTGTASVNNGATAVTGGSSSWVGNASAGDYIGFTANVTETDPVAWYKIAVVGGDTSITLASAFQQANVTSGTYIVSSANPFPNQFDDVLKNYALSKAYARSGDLKAEAAAWSFVELAMKSARKALVKTDTMIVPVGAGEQTYSGRKKLIIYNQLV